MAGFCMRLNMGYVLIPVVCYGAKGKYGIHRICRRCAIYRKYDSIPEKPCYRLHGIHLLGRRECPIFEQKIIKITKNK